MCKNQNSQKRLFRLVVLAAFGCALLLKVGDAHAQSRSLCPNESTRSAIKVSTAPTKYIKNRTANNLTSHHNTGSGVTLGLAGGPIEIAIKSSFSITTRKTSACVKLEKVDVHLKAKPEIHIASNFKKGSCEYTQILAHEQKHIRTQSQFIREYTPKLAREIRKIIRTTETQKIISESHVKRAQEQIQADIIERINAYQEKIMEVLRSRQTRIDSPEEYARVARACNNWNRKLVHNN